MVAAFRGSFGYNELINYYIGKEEHGRELAYAYELMGHKLAAFRHTPDTVIAQYTAESGKMTEPEFKKFMEDEFEVTDREYLIISKLVPREGEVIDVSQLIDMMKAGGLKRGAIIRPNSVNTRLLLKDGLTALRCCL
jgi:hypothetical protein